MTVHEDDVAIDHGVGHRDGLLRVAGIVADFQLQLLAQHTAAGVDVGNGHFRTLADLVAGRRVLAGHRAGDGDGQVGQRRSGQGAEGAAGSGEQGFLHG